MPDVLRLHESAPEFTLKNEEGREVSLVDFRGSPVLLFFYPGDFTPVCTAEVCEFQVGFEEFTRRGVVLIGISPDTPESHQRFAEKYSLPFTLLCDPGMVVASKFGARGLLGMRRAYFLLDGEGRVLWQYSELLPIFRTSNERLLESIDLALAKSRRNRSPATAHPAD